jgi:hypothetical protein
VGLFRRKRQPSTGVDPIVDPVDPQGGLDPSDYQTAFLQEMTVRLGDEYPGVVITPTDDFGLSLVHPDGQTGRLNFDTIWAECQHLDVEQRNVRLQFAVKAARPAQRPSTFDEARLKLLPSLRSLSYIGSSTDHQFVYRPKGAFLVELIAIDEEFGISFVTRSDLAEWGVDEVTLFNAANLNFSEVEFGMDTQANTAKRQVFGPDGFSSSLLLASSVCQQIESAHGPAVFVAPSREIAYAIFLGDAAAASQALLEVTDEYRHVPRQLSPVPYQLLNGQLVEWDPPIGDLSRTAVDNAQRILSSVEYSAQREALQEQFVENDDDVFVAQVSLIDMERSLDQAANEVSPRGRLASYTVWPRTVTNGLLPIADKIAFQGADDAPFFVDFALAREYVGDLLVEDPAFAPPRFRFHSFPSQTIIDQLQSVATDL